MKQEQLIGKNKNGFATLEILIAFAIVILCIGAVIIVNFGNQSISVDTETSNEATAKAQALLEKARAVSKDDFNSVNPTTTTETSGALTYTKTLGVETSVVDPSLDLWTKRVTSIVTWQQAGRTLFTKLTTLLTNKNIDDTCGSVLSGDWSNPQMYSWEFGKDLLVPSDTSSGFPLGGIDVFNGKLYVVVNNSNGNNLPTFFKFNLSSDPTVKPTFVSSMDNSPTVKAGLNAVTVHDHYAYVANAYGSNFDTCGAVPLACSQLQIIDIDTMTVVGKLKIPGATGSGGQSVGNAIFYKDGIIYLGLSKTNTGPEFNVIDVGGGGAGGSPLNPVHMSGLSIGNGVNSIYVKDNYAYVASPNDEELKVIDLTSTSQIGQYNAPGGGGNNGNGKSIFKVGNTIYLGRTLLSGDELYILNKVFPNLTRINSANIIGGGSNTSVNGILVRDYLIFLLTNDDFQILEKDSSYNVTQYATPLPTPGGSGTTIDCEGNYIYFGSVPGNDKGYVAVVTPGVPAAPPPFDYTLNDDGDITVQKGGPAVTNTITVTMDAGATPQIVTLSNGSLATGLSVTYSPVSQACTPSATTPYTCTVVLSFTALASAPNSNDNVTITGVSAGIADQTTVFKVKVQP